jgi:hypothetical protein
MKLAPGRAASARHRSPRQQRFRWQTGRRVLLVSTDPASNLGQVLECAVGDTIGGVPRLHTLNIDPRSIRTPNPDRVDPEPPPLLQSAI